MDGSSHRVTEGQEMSPLTYQSSSSARADMFPADPLDVWFVLRTKSRQEKILANELRSRGIANFLPIVTCTKYYAGRKASVELPVFPGYLFLRGDTDEAYDADRTRRVAQIIKVSDQDRLDRELRTIHLALCSGAPLDPFPYLKAGVAVQVREGPFRGLRGVIEPGGSGRRLVLQVEILGRA